MIVAAALVAAVIAAVVPHAGADARSAPSPARAAEVPTDPVPAAYVDTMAKRGAQHGIQVGDAFYPEAAGKHWAQMLVLNRETLAPAPSAAAANTSFDCPYPRGDAKRLDCVTEMRKKIAGLTDGDLVIVSNQPDGTPPYTLEFALEYLGIGNDTEFRNSRELRPGDFSSISVVGAKGVAHWHAVIPGQGTPAAAGRMNDWLFREPDRKYVFAPSGRVSFDTAASGSTATENIIEIGHDRFRAGSGTGGFQVVVADRQTLKGTSHFFRTHETGDAGIGALEAMERTLAAANSASGERPLVLVASLGDPRVNWYHGADANKKLNETISHVVDQLETLGGTRNAAYKALDPGLSPHPQSYTLVGAGRRGHAGGDEAVGERSGHGLNSRPMSGMLARTGPGYTFQVQDIPSTGGEAEGRDPVVGARALTRLAFQLPSDWPEHGNPGRTAAIAWIGVDLVGTPNLRGQYWTKANTGSGEFNEATFKDLAAKIGKLAYPAGAAFTEADLTWAKAELQQEISWLISVHRYASALSAPFSATALEDWSAMQGIANEIRDKVQISGDQKIHMSGKALFDGLRSVLAAIPVAHIGHVVHAVDTIYETIMQLIEINNEPAEADFQDRADKVGEALAKRLSAAQTMLRSRLPDTIAADYGKLKVAGACASEDAHDWSACPFDHSDWVFTKTDQEIAAHALKEATEMWAYGKLLPERYRAYRLPEWWRQKVNDNEDFIGKTAFTRWYPFKSLPDSAQLAVPILRNLPHYAHRIEGLGHHDLRNTGETWQIWALGFLTGDGTIGAPWVMNSPPASLMDHVFKHPPAGLGADPESFFVRNFKPSTLDHYPERDTPTGWCESKPVSCT